MLKKEIKEVFKQWNQKIIKIFKKLFIERKGPNGYYFERKDHYERIYCHIHLYKTINFIADIRVEIFSNL